MLPDLPSQTVTTDLFEWKQRTFLLIMDYYSWFVEIARLTRATAEEVITHTKSIFARHGIPEVVISDNGPQYASDAYATFAKDYQFYHFTSSPYFAHSNGEAERAVGTIKNLLKESDDPYLALLAYRATVTPLQRETVESSKPLVKAGSMANGNTPVHRSTRTSHPPNRFDPSWTWTWTVWTVLC